MKIGLFISILFTLTQTFAENATQSSNERPPSNTTAAVTSSGVTGQWKTIDDETGEPKSIVELNEIDGQLTGKIIKLFRKPTEEQNPKCDKCIGDKKNQPLIGMTILWDMKKKRENKWDGGSIMDPKNGKTYSCKIELLEGGKKLKVRGYLGFSLLGRSQIWVRP